MKNGPNPKYLSASGRHHWFDGDGMVHAIKITGGKLYYCNRYIKTPKYLQDIKAGYAYRVKVGELYGIGLIKAGLVGLKQKIGFMTKIEPLESATANTAFIHHSKRTFALVEVDYPFHIKPELNQMGNFDVKSIGHDNFDGDLTHNVSAHPKVDMRTGELLTFGYSNFEPYLYYSAFNEKRERTASTKVKISSPRMIHDFSITENYIIFPDLPLEVRGDLAIRKS